MPVTQKRKIVLCLLRAQHATKWLCVIVVVYLVFEMFDLILTVEYPILCNMIILFYFSSVFSFKFIFFPFSPIFSMFWSASPPVRRSAGPVRGSAGPVRSGPRVRGSAGPVRSAGPGYVPPLPDGFPGTGIRYHGSPSPDRDKIIRYD
jgi:hypothetical protein